MIETLREWLKDAEPLASPAQIEHLRALTAAMATPDLRDECRRLFKLRFGEPRYLTLGQLEEAELFIRGFAALHDGREAQDEGDAGDGLPHQPEFHDDGGASDEGPKAEPAEEPAEAEPAKKTRKPRAKAGADGSSASSQPDAGPGEAPPAAGDDGDPEPEAPASGAPGASDGVTPAASPDDGRSWLTQQVLKSPAKLVDSIRETLDDADLWPVDQIEDERVAEAIALVAYVVDIEAKSRA